VWRIVGNKSTHPRKNLLVSFSFTRAPHQAKQTCPAPQRVSPLFFLLLTIATPLTHNAQTQHRAQHGEGEREQVVDQTHREFAVFSHPTTFLPCCCPELQNGYKTPKHHHVRLEAQIPRLAIV
jgi:hypothetical protein